MRHQADRYIAPAHEAHNEQVHPDVDEVLQRPQDMITVPVRHEGPITSQELPAVLGTLFVVTATTSPQVLLPANRSRKKATIISTDNAFQVIRQRNANGTGTAVPWPANVPLPWTSQSELSVQTSTGTATISVITEDWAR